MHDHLHGDRQYGVKEKQTHADTNDVGEVSFRSAASEAVAAATEQDYSEAGRQIRLDESEKQLDRHDYECSSNDKC